MQTLADCLAEKNAKTAAWVAEAPDSRWASGLTEDLTHWARYGVTTAAQLEHYLLVCDVYETTKAAWGFKPSWGGLMEKSDAELSAMLPALQAEAEAQMEREAAWEVAQAEAEAREEREHAEAVARAMQCQSGWPLAMAFAAL